MRSMKTQDVLAISAAVIASLCVIVMTVLQRKPVQLTSPEHEVSTANIHCSPLSSNGISSIKFLLCLVSHFSSSVWSRVAKGSGEMVGKESCILLGSLLNGFTMCRSARTLPSSVAVDLCVWDVDKVALLICMSKFPTIFRCPPAARLASSIALSVLFAPIPFMDFLMSLFWFSWRRSISMFLPWPPFQLTVAAHMQWCDSASESKASFCTMLIIISIAYALKPGNALKCKINCLWRAASLSPLPSLTASLKSLNMK